MKMDGLLTQFKGPKFVSIENPPFRPMSQVAVRNRRNAVPMMWENGQFVHVTPQPDPAFGLDSTQQSGLGADGYDSDDDPDLRGTDLLDLTQLDEKSRREADFINRSMH
jgi:hypothetical protein